MYVRGLAICEARMPPDHPRILHIQAKLEALRKSLFRFPGLPPQHDDLEPAE